MPPSSRTKDRIYEYLATHGPSSSKEITQALDISQPAISQVLRAETDFRKVEIKSALIYSWQQTKQRPTTIAYTLADNIRSAAQLHEDLKSLDPNDELGIRELAREFIHKSNRQARHLLKLLEDTDPEIYDAPAS